MKTYIILILGVFSINSYAQKTTDEKKESENKSHVETIKVRKDESLFVEEQAPEIFTVVEEMPSFPGGYTEMMKFIQENLIFPESAIKNKTYGKCFVKFVVQKDGRISDITVLKGVPNCLDCDEEAKKVFTKMPKWIPGKQNGRQVNVYYNQPINFQPK